MERKRNNIISFTLMALTLIILITNTMNMTLALSPADLSPTPMTTYSIEFSIMFGTDENNEQFHHQNSYMANQFHCYLTDTKEYLVAEYDETAQRYVLTSYTKNKDEATVFIGGKDIDNTKMVIITGLTANNYTIDHLKATEGYTTIRKPIHITITPNGVTVYGEEISITDDNRIIFRIALTPGYDLSDYYTSNTAGTYLIVTSISTFVLICCTFTIVIMYANYKRRKAVRDEAKRIAMNEETNEIIMHITDFNGDATTIEPVDAIIETIDEMPAFTNDTIVKDEFVRSDVEINSETIIPDTTQTDNIVTNDTIQSEPADKSEDISATSETNESEDSNIVKTE